MATQVYKVAIVMAGKPKFYEQVEAASISQAMEIMKARYPGCMAHVESSAKRVSPRH